MIALPGSADPGSSSGPADRLAPMPIVSALYAAAARARRDWYAARPDRRRRLERPVVSIGNLAVGGSGKTPAVAHLARLLVEAGERPAILSEVMPAHARPTASPSSATANVCSPTSTAPVTNR